MSVISSDYFSLQKRMFAGLGINLMSSHEKSTERLIHRPWVLCGIILTSLCHCVLIVHYAYDHVTSFMEVTDVLPVICQFILCYSKVAIFVSKSDAITLLIKEIHRINFEAKNEQMAIVRRENAKNNVMCTAFFRMVFVTAAWATVHPFIYGLYVYFSTGEIILTAPMEATYFWNYYSFSGYSLVYALNMATIYFTCCVSIAFDTLYCWFVGNIVAQFLITEYNFDQLGVQQAESVIHISDQRMYASIVKCIKYQRQALQLAEKLNGAYEQIIFMKFVLMCLEISCQIFQIGRPKDSLAELGYKCCFLSAITSQLMLYCWNGQRIKDESEQVSTSIYCAVDWSTLSISAKKSLLIAMMRSQKCSRVTGIFFELDLSLFVWVFKTAGSLLTALKTMDENQV